MAKHLFFSLATKITIVLIGFIMVSFKPGNVVLESPNQLHQVSFILEKGKIYYSVNSIHGETIINKSALGFKLKNDIDLSENFAIKKTSFSTRDTTWTQPWGEQTIVKDHFNEMYVRLQNKEGILDIRFRAYNDGIAFRYEFPGKSKDSLLVIDELTEFHIHDTASKSWWIPAYTSDKYEHLYRNTVIKVMDTAHTPLTIERSGNKYLCFHEADLDDWPSFTLYPLNNKTLKTDLVPWSDGIKVKATYPHQSSWRMVIIADSPQELIGSTMMLNLNEPNKLGDVSWVKPSKYIGIWWGMHDGAYSWKEGPNHGATTQRAKEYIDFAAKHGFEEVLVEGWNKGWDDIWWKTYGKNMSFIKPADDYDLFEVQRYAQERGVTIQGYHETCANPENYFSQIDSAFKLCQQLGYRSVKIGQVGPKLMGREWHHGQYGVNYYRTVLKKAASYKLAVNFHEPIKGTGEWRTYPNMLAREGARGQEYNAWSSDGGNPPSHVTILPFTRMIAGPMDYTPGIFNLDIPLKKNRIPHTICKELSLYVILYSPIQMAADRIEHYTNDSLFAFIRRVPVEWDTTIILGGKIGEYITIARKEKNTDNWFVSSITNEDSREVAIDLSFLNNDAKYEATIYRDGENADYLNNPYSAVIEKRSVNSSETLEFQLGRSGGVVMEINRENRDSQR